MTWPYIAGFFDGEGSIVVHRGNHGVFRIQIVQSEQNGGEAVLKEIASFLEQYGIHSNIHRSKKREGHCCMFSLNIGQLHSVVKFLKFLFPYLRVKRSLAQDVIRYAAIFPNYRDSGIYRGFCEPHIPRPWLECATHNRNRSHKITQQTAQEIISLKGTGIFQKDVARKFGVSRSLIEHMWLGKRWNWANS